MSSFATLELQPFPSEGCLFVLAFGRGELYSCEAGMDRGAMGSLVESPLYALPVAHHEAYIKVESQPYHGTIDLSAIEDGQKFTVMYYLRARADTVEGDGINNAEAYIGDPLNVDSGFQFETTSVPAPDDGKPLRLCDSEVGKLRYTNHSDGSVTDTYTGLMWQRCPAGYSLNENGTPDDIADDRCAVTGDTDSSWQEALKRGTSDTTAGYTDLAPV